MHACSQKIGHSRQWLQAENLTVIVTYCGKRCIRNLDTSTTFARCARDASDIYDVTVMSRTLIEVA